MLRLLWLVPALPLLGYLLLLVLGGRLPARLSGAIGVSSVGLSALITLLVALAFMQDPPAGNSYTQAFWQWMAVGDFSPGITFRLDPLSLTMTGVITGVGFLIHLYSLDYMAGDPGYARFFAYMNLFVAAMLILVLADNLLLLYLGWEGVGLASFLLIGFWYQDPANGKAARKAFVITRAGDTAMLLGILLLFSQLGSLDIQTLMQQANATWAPGSALAVATAALLLGGALGKSAQIPLQTWLPDAMAGPTPVSALIHAATMVTAGVYLIARTHEIFSLAPVVQHAVAILGAATLLLAGFSALAQTDIKRILAYSTMSQIGYMFLALGVGAWSAAMFHFMAHAFFKALLFMAAGAIIIALHHEQNIFRMGGLRKSLPLVFWTFLIGAAALAALPLITAGFYSKDLILWQAWSSPLGSPWLWAAGWIGAFVTGLYTFRLIFIVFFGEPQTPVHKKPGWVMILPLLALSLLSIIGGFVETPPSLGNIQLFSRFLEPVLPVARAGHAGNELLLQGLASAAALLGIALAYRLFLPRPGQIRHSAQSRPDTGLQAFWRGGAGFDWLYEHLLVRPYVAIARLNRWDVLDRFFDGVAQLNLSAHLALKRTQTGQLRWYAGGIVLGSVLILAVAVFT